MSAAPAYSYLPLHDAHGVKVGRTLVDPHDAERLSHHHWLMLDQRPTGRCRAYRRLPGRPSRRVWLHEEIAGRRALHLDGNPLMNCRSNLRGVLSPGRRASRGATEPPALQLVRGGKATTSTNAVMPHATVEALADVWADILVADLERRPPGMSPSR